MKAVCSQFQAIAAMDESIASSINLNFPKVKTFVIPYVIDPQHIVNPLLDTQRNINILQLGRFSERRRRAEQLFHKKNITANFIYNGQYSENTYRLIAESKISLNIHIDGGHIYFGQHRIFDAWAAGSLLVTEPFGSSGLFGIVPGKNIVICQISDMADCRKDLLTNVVKRTEII